MPHLHDFQALLFDIDGTLLGKTLDLSPRVASCLDQLHQQGLTTGVCTGRSFNAVKYFFKEFPEDSVHVTAGGAQVVENQTIKWEACIPHEVALDLYQQLAPYPVNIAIAKPDAIYQTDDYIHETLQHPWNIPVKPLSTLENFQTPEMVVFELEHETKKIITDNSFVTPKFLISRRGTSYADITTKGVTKQTGLKQWSQITGIPLEKVIGFGDGNNDLEFLQCVGYSVAMGNATESIKNCANRVIGSVHEDGLATYLEQLLKGEPI